MSMLVCEWACQVRDALSLLLAGVTADPEVDVLFITRCNELPPAYHEQARCFVVTLALAKQIAGWDRHVMVEGNKFPGRLLLCIQSVPSERDAMRAQVCREFLACPCHELLSNYSDLAYKVRLNYKAEFEDAAVAGVVPAALWSCLLMLRSF